MHIEELSDSVREELLATPVALIMIRNAAIIMRLSKLSELSITLPSGATFTIHSDSKSTVPSKS